ncbi:MAG: hypothetical protein NC344_11630 [Bacteroidales bacterium]|nr:hypothetical protein [Bacteroidales bacterium]
MKKITYRVLGAVLLGCVCLTLFCTSAAAQTMADGIEELVAAETNSSYSLDLCRTIDKELTELCRSLLEEDLKAVNGLYGQVFVMESQTGHIKAWVALEDESCSGKYSDAPLWKHQLSTCPLKSLRAIRALVESNTSVNDSVDTKCGIDTIGGMQIRDHNWRRGGYGLITYLDGFKRHSNIAFIRAMEKSNHANVKHDWLEVTDNPRVLNAMSVATIYNSIALEGKKVVMPSVNTDSIRIAKAAGFPGKDAQTARIFKQYLKATLQNDGIGSRWITKEVDISGDFVTHRNCRPTIYDVNAPYKKKRNAEDVQETYSHIIFIGYFPSDNPRYTICVTMDKQWLPLSGMFIRRTVNGVVEYLNKH